MQLSDQRDRVEDQYKNKTIIKVTTTTTTCTISTTTTTITTTSSTTTTSSYTLITTTTTYTITTTPQAGKSFLTDGAGWLQQLSDPLRIQHSLSTHGGSLQSQFFHANLADQFPIRF